MEKIERICIINFVFKILAFAGIAAVLAVSALSDSETLDFATTFIYGSLGFLSAAVGIWGTVNCSRIIRSYRKAYNRVIVRNRKTANAA